MSVITACIVAAENDKEPGNSSHMADCPMGIAGVRYAPSFSATTCANFSAINVSVVSGKCVPCCSVEPMGTTATRTFASSISFQVFCAVKIIYFPTVNARHLRHPGRPAGLRMLMRSAE